MSAEQEIHEFDKTYHSDHQSSDKRAAIQQTRKNGWNFQAI